MRYPAAINRSAGSATTISISSRTSRGCRERDFVFLRDCSMGKESTCFSGDLRCPSSGFAISTSSRSLSAPSPRISQRETSSSRATATSRSRYGQACPSRSCSPRARSTAGCSRTGASAATFPSRSSGGWARKSSSPSISAPRSGDATSCARCSPSRISSPPS